MKHKGFIKVAKVLKRAYEKALILDMPMSKALKRVYKTPINLDMSMSIVQEKWGATTSCLSGIYLYQV